MNGDDAEYALHVFVQIMFYAFLAWMAYGIGEWVWQGLVRAAKREKFSEDEAFARDNDDAGWIVAQVDCDRCGSRQASVAPASCAKLECVICGHMNPNPLAKK